MIGTHCWEFPSRENREIMLRVFDRRRKVWALTTVPYLHHFRAGCGHLWKHVMLCSLKIQTCYIMLPSNYNVTQLWTFALLNVWFSYAFCAVPGDVLRHYFLRRSVRSRIWGCRRKTAGKLRWSSGRGWTMKIGGPGFFLGDPQVTMLSDSRSDDDDLGHLM